MGIKIGNMDIANSILELEFQTKINSMIIEQILNNDSHGLNQHDIQKIRQRAADAINSKYGQGTISLNE